MVGEADTVNNKLSLLIFLLGLHIIHYFLFDRYHAILHYQFYSIQIQQQ